MKVIYFYIPHFQAHIKIGMLLDYSTKKQISLYHANNIP